MPHLIPVILNEWKKFAAGEIKSSAIVYTGNENFTYDGTQVVAWDHCYEFLGRLNQPIEH